MTTDIDLRCADCCTDIDTGDWYMVHDHVWRSATDLPAPRARFLCVPCLEHRLGRQLLPEDFTDAPVNHPPFERREQRLASRHAGQLVLDLGGAR